MMEFKLFVYGLISFLRLMDSNSFFCKIIAHVSCPVIVTMLVVCMVTLYQSVVNFESVKA